MKRKVVLGITGASGAPYARRLAEVLASRREALEVGVCLSSTAPEVWALECGGDVREALASLGLPVWGLRDYKAPFASGSAGWHAMVVVPCSMGTIASPSSARSANAGSGRLSPRSA